MIATGSMIVLETGTAIYSPCKVIRQDQSMVRNKDTGEMEAHLNSITVSYMAGMKRNPKTKRMEEDWRQETILRKDITKLQKT